MQSTRRQFIQTLAGSVLGVTCSPMFSQAADEPKRIPIGLQLYAIRGEFERSVPDTLKAVSQLGYQGVEFWGYAGMPTVYQQYTAKQLRELLDQNGLKCCGMHLELKALSGPNLMRTIDANKTLGSEYLTVAGAKEKMETETGIIELAEQLKQAARICRPHGLTVGYHAHPFDFIKHKEVFAWQLLFRRLGPEHNMQMDVGNCLAGNGDPIAMLKEFPGRTFTIHIKEHQEKTFDSDYYKEVFHLCETTARTKWYIVEMGGPEGNGFDVPKQALAALRRVGKA
jgi:sugar phosphate isomerase/epimerase